MTDMRTINDMAARWHAQVMIGRLSPEEEQRLDDWLAQDVRHRLAYAEVAAAGLRAATGAAECRDRQARRPQLAGLDDCRSRADSAGSCGDVVTACLAELAQRCSYHSRHVACGNTCRMDRRCNWIRIRR
jgi:ferric-dicitrate binding protein FerR (iron transport regulator)